MLPNFMVSALTKESANTKGGGGGGWIHHVVPREGHISTDHAMRMPVGHRKRDTR